MKTNLLRTLWIMLLSSWWILEILLKSILLSYRKQNTREWVDTTIHQWSKRILKLVRATCVVVNPYHVAPKAGQPTIIMCNHSSLYDIPLSLYAFPNVSIRMLAKKELSKIPFMKRGMDAAGFPFVDRKNRAQAIKDLEKVSELLRDGFVMWIAPEGTRSKDGHLAPFKKGGFITAIETKATIIPIGIRGANTILPARTFRFQLNQTAEVHIGQPIDAAQYTLENKDQLISTVHQAIKELIGE